MIEYTNYHNNMEEEEEEALSLCDLALDEDEEDEENQKESSKMSSQTRRSSSEAPEFFEFFSDFSSENMCSAEDIIFCGKLIPFQDFKNHNNSDYTTPRDKRHLSFCPRSESLSGLHSSIMTRSNSINTTKLMMRNSRSLDYRKLERLSRSNKTSPESDTSFDRNSSVRSIGKSDRMVKKAVKPRWYVLMFGVIKPPKEMELKDIKNRQVRRNIIFPPTAADTVKKPPISKGSCKLLSMLSCRDPASVAVTTSFYTQPV